ncbi:MAG: c-type cytochrome [Pseudomonadota bacterium]
MNFHKVLVALLLMLLTVSSYAGSSRPVVDQSVPADDTVSHGGRLYDKWWTELGMPEPTTTHPAYPDSGAKRGADTWRCKECHGWDYRGSDGAYAKGSHYTGIKGIRDYEGADPAAVLRILSNANHQYSQFLAPEALEYLSEFVISGQVDMAGHIDAESKKVIGGELKRGEALYENNCARCHGEDGRNLNFSGNPDDPEYVGTLARGNPWESWHKIRNGHPGSAMPMGPGMMGRWRPNESMPPFRSLSLEEQLAILTYTRSLPAK